MSERLPEHLASALDATRDRRGAFGARLEYYGEIGSTNDAAAALAERGAAEGTAVIASAQTSGRGRLGRGWYSPPDAGLYVSVIIRRAGLARLLTLAAGVAIAEGITQATGLPVELKWPNDVIVRGPRGARRKLAGILAEGSAARDRVIYVVLGYGINLRDSAYPPEFATRATSIESELGRPVDAGAVLSETLVCLAARCAELADGRCLTVLERWRQLAPSAHGGRVECQTPSGRASGVSLGIGADGALLVRIGERVERILSGEVIWA